MKPSQYIATLSLLAFALLIRWLVAQFPHSGQKKPPMYGDYEAQRHWMEITTNLPVRDWYKNTTDNDLLYWGLDYPPLTAYHMYILGYTSNKILNSSWTELHESRGTETYEHKLYMRSTVILADFLIYLPAIVYYFYNNPPILFNSPPLRALKQNIAAYTFLALFYPGQILIDHGHFQYNCVFMGLTLWAIIFMAKGRQAVSAILFTLALSYKQMSLYYSMPFFWYIASSNLRVRPFYKGLGNIISVGIIVISTFALIFIPYIDSLESFTQVLSRLFPFNRGLFEDKVANVGFSLSIFYKYRNLYSINDLLKISTLFTLIFSLPAGIHILFRPTIRNFKYALVNTSLVFFLLSFQVHEKTILVPALPVLLLYREHPMAANLFAIVSTFSLQPLLVKDGQLVPYFVLMITYTLVSLECFKSYLDSSFVNSFIYLLSTIGCFILSILAVTFTPPTRYPHLHPTVNALYCCGHFLCFSLFFYYQQLFGDKRRQVTSDRILLIKKTK